MIIDNQTIDRIIKNTSGIPNFDTGEPFYPNAEQKVEIKSMFKALMKEDVNKNLSPINQQTLLEGIMESFANNDNYFDAFTFRSDNKHMIGYDNALKLGEGQRIIEILNSYNMGASVLKGVALFQPFDGYVDKEKRVYVKEEIENPDNESPYVKLFEIYIDGKLVYQWKGRAFGEGDIYENLNTQQETVKQPKRKSEYRGSFYTEFDDIPIKEWIDKNGRTFYTKGSKRISRNSI